MTKKYVKIANLENEVTEMEKEIKFYKKEIKDIKEAEEEQFWKGYKIVKIQNKP